MNKLSKPCRVIARKTQMDYKQRLNITDTILTSIMIVCGVGILILSFIFNYSASVARERAESEQAMHCCCCEENLNGLKNGR